MSPPSGLRDQPAQSESDALAALVGAGAVHLAAGVAGDNLRCHRDRDDETHVHAGLVDEARDLHVRRRADELESGDRAGGQDARAVAGLRAPRDRRALGVADDRVGLRRAPQAAARSATLSETATCKSAESARSSASGRTGCRVEERGLAQRGRALGRRVAEVVAGLRASSGRDLRGQTRAMLIAHVIDTVSARSATMARPRRTVGWHTRSAAGRAGGRSARRRPRRATPRRGR